MSIAQPKNESETHFFLKELGKYILFSMGYTRLATEVDSMWSLDGGRDKKMNMKGTIDVAGIKKVSKFIPNSGFTYKHRWVLCGIEAKASLSDFKNGFCIAPALTYIIAPKGIIPYKEIPPKIGLIEVDISNASVKKMVNKIDAFTGIEIPIRAKNRLDSRFKTKEDYQNFCSQILESIAYRATSELLFWRNVIPLEGKPTVLGDVING